MDRFSPVAPAQIRVLVLPVGQIDRSRYLAFLDRLKEEGSIIRSADLEPYSKEERLLSPKASSESSIFYNYTVAAPSEQHQQLSPYELFREPLLVLGLKDGASSEDEKEQEQLQAAAELLRERHPRVVHRQLLVLQDANSSNKVLSDSIIPVRNAAQSGDPSLKQAVCRFSVRFLAELGTYVQALQASPTVQTPGQTARRLQRAHSLKEREKQATSGYKTPPQSMELSRPVDQTEESRSNSAPGNRSPPATSFDQISSANGVSNRTARPESQSSNKSRSSIRASSQDRMSMQGFGSLASTSQEKTKAKGKARVGIVVGFLYLMAGHWQDAMRMFVEHTSKARILSDLLWHAKGLEGTVVCMLLQAWAGLEFQIPSICYAVSERTSSANGQRFSLDISSQPRSAEIREPSNSQLADCLPGLLKFTVGLYHSGEGSLELPFIAIADATIRFCKLLAILRHSGGDLNRSTIENFIKSGTESTAPVPTSVSPTKKTIADMLSYADISSEDNVSVADQAAILAGTASVYALLQMKRKQAATIKDLVVKLTEALTQARKRGAAEMGIHPAASLSAEIGTSAMLSIAEESGGLNQMLSKVAAIYGVPPLNFSASEADTYNFSHFGNDNLKLAFIRAVAAFCEASPDPQGLLRVNASMLRIFGPNAAVDAEPSKRSTRLSKDEQIRCVAVINRTIGVSKLLGLPEIEASFWDDFLIRDVEFIPGEPGQAVADLSQLMQGQAVEQTPGNPLLYDPHENRPKTGDEVQQTNILVSNETSVCRVTLQNPYQVSLEVEALRLITNGVELSTSHQRFTIAPLGIQRVSISVSPSIPGDCEITGCTVKIQGCHEQNFRIVGKPWSPPTPTMLKEPGMDLRSKEDATKDKLAIGGPEYKTVSVTVIEPQPLLVFDDSSLMDSTLMLLDGEAYELTLSLRNTSNIPASIFDIVTANDAMQLQEDFEDDDSSSETSTPTRPTVVEPGESAQFTFDVVGKPTLFQVRVAFHYSCHPNGSHGRILSVPINMTVNAGLQVQRLEALPLDIAQNGEHSFVWSIDVGNAWPKSLFYSCFVSDLGLKSAEPRRCHNHEGVLAPGQFQRVFMPIARPHALDDDEDDADVIQKALLERLRIIWNVEDEDRMGEIDVSGLTMSSEALRIVAGDAMRLGLGLVETEDESQPGPNTVKVGSLATLRAKLSNRASRSYPLIVQLHSRALNSTDYTHFGGQFAVAGAQQRFVPSIPQGGSETVDFAFCPLLAGIIELEVVTRAVLPKDKSGPQWTSRQTMCLTVI